MRKLIVLLALGVLALVASCSTKNVGSGNPLKGPQNVQIVVPTGIQPGETGTFTVTFQGGVGPFTIEYTFAGGATDVVTVGPRALTGDHSDQQTVTFVGSTTGATNGSVTVTVRDQANNLSASDTENFTVPIIPNQNPTITGTFAGGTFTLDVADADDPAQDVTVTGTAPAGFTLAPGSRDVPGGDGQVTFTISGGDIFAGGNGTVTFTATDSEGGTGTVDVNFTTPPIDLAPDTLYAIPLQSTAAVDETVTIVVATGVPANPFQYLTGCRVCAPTASDMDYVAGTFNVGAPGGATTEIDGFWTAMNPTGTPPFINPSDFIARSDTGDGRWGIDVNVTPTGGSEVTNAEGALFNIGVSFGAAGTWPLTFQQFETVNRTYYQDANQAPDYFWSDIDNDNGAPNSVTVQ